MSGDAFWEFERAGWERAAPSYEECWTDTELFVQPLLDAAAVGAGSRLLAPVWRVPTAERLFDALLHAGVRVGSVLRAQPPERLEAIRAAIVDGVRRYADGDEFALPLVARVVSAATDVSPGRL